MKRILALSLALVLLLGIASSGTLSYFSDTEPSTGNTICAGLEGCTCSMFNVSDDKEDKLYKYDASGTLVGSFNLATANPYKNKKPEGVAAVGEYVYVLDHSHHKVFRYGCCGGTPDVSGTLVRKDSDSKPGNPSGLAIDGDEMWMVVWGQDFIIYRYSVLEAFASSGKINAKQEIAPHSTNTKPAGLAIGPTYLYTLDATNKHVYRYDRSTGDCGDDDISAELRDSIGGLLGNPSGTMLAGTSLWIVDYGTDKMYEYDIASLFSGSVTVNAIWEFALAAENGDASGM